MMPLARALAIVMVLSPVAALAQPANLTGIYTVEGQNPTGQGNYRGEVAIASSGETFRIVWRLGSQQYEGTGLLRDGKLAVVFQTGGQAGVALYDVRSSGTLTGTWTMQGGQSVGTETLTPKGRT